MYVLEYSVLCAVFGTCTKLKPFQKSVIRMRFQLQPQLAASSPDFIFYHLAPYTVSPTDLVVRCSTWEGEGHKTKAHAHVMRTVCVDHFRKNAVTRKIVQLV